MWNMNSGYSGYSMSNRAVDAYEDGEMPLSKWTKKMIISEVVEHEHFTEEELKKLEARKAHITYLEWGGTRAHPKATNVDAYAVIIGNWAYLEDGKKKSICSNGFKVNKYLDRAPRGSAVIFKRILKRLPDAVKKKI